jgi:hypothetical protein
VSFGTGFPAQLSGSALPSARVAPVGGGETAVDVGRGLAAVGDASVVVQEPAINATATTRGIRRARMTRTLHLLDAVVSKETPSRYSDAMTSSGMSKLA